MSFGVSNTSKYGSVSEFAEGRLRSSSGDDAATEASFDKKGSLGFRGGNGILALLTEQSAPFKPRRFWDGDEDEEDEHRNDNVMGSWKIDAIFSSQSRIFSSVQFNSIQPFVCSGKKRTEVQSSPHRLG